jgi:hypothetical protein
MALSVQGGASRTAWAGGTNLDHALGNPQGIPWRHCKEPAVAAPGPSHAGAIGGVKGCRRAPLWGEGTGLLDLSMPLRKFDQKRLTAILDSINSFRPMLRNTCHRMLKLITGSSIY